MARAVFGRGTRTSNTQQSGVRQGTMGGAPRAAGGRPGLRIMAGDEVYLWVLVILEVLAMGALRRRFRRYHGG